MEVAKNMLMNMDLDTLGVCVIVLDLTKIVHLVFHLGFNACLFSCHIFGDQIIVPFCCVTFEYALRSTCSFHLFNFMATVCLFFSPAPKNLPASRSFYLPLLPSICFCTSVSFFVDTDQLPYRFVFD